MPIALLWYFTFGRSQSKYVMNKFKNGYIKNSWLIPFCIFIIVWGLLILLGTNVESDSQFVKY